MCVTEIWAFRSAGKWRGASWLLVTAVFGQPIGTIFKGPDRLSRNGNNYYQLTPPKIPEELELQIYRGRSLKYRKKKSLLLVTFLCANTELKNNVTFLDTSIICWTQKPKIKSIN